MAYHPQQTAKQLSDRDERDPGLAIPTKITTSQQSVLDQLHNHVAFSESLIFLSGPQGAGKTTLLEVFLEQASDYANLAFSPVPPQSKADTLRSKLLRQLVSLDAYSTDDSILEALQRNVKTGRQHMIICIDNGANLPQQLLAELQELVSSRHLFNPEHRVSVVITGESNWVKRASKGVALGASEAPVVIEIPPFFKREQQWFARKLAATQAEHSDHAQRIEPQISDWLSQTQGYPGQIQAVLEHELLKRPHTEQAMQARRNTLRNTQQLQPKRAPMRLSGNQLLAVLIGAAALIALAIAMFLHQQEDGESEIMRDEAREQETVPVAPIVNDVSVSDTQEDTAEEVEAPEASSQAPVMDFDVAMSRLRERAQERPTPREIEFQLVQPVNYLAQQSESPDDTDHDDAGDSVEVETSQSEPADYPYDNLALWQRDPSRYVFQVAAFNSQPRMMQFLAGYDHPELAIYQTLRGDETWYMVLVGDFESADNARAYLASNEDLQRIQPWLKAMRLVHDDLAPVMQDVTQDNNN